MATRARQVSETLYAFGQDVRVERGPETGDKDAPMVWFVYKKVDVTDDEETTYEYRFDEVARFPEDVLGEMPDAARDRAQALSSE